MDSEVSLSRGADKLIGLKLDLREILGEGWKKHCIFSNLEQAISAEEYQMIQNARTVHSTEARTHAEQFIVKANNIFTANDSLYRAQLLTNQQGKQLVYIAGRIGNDTIYHITEDFIVINQFFDSGAVQWTSKRIGFIGKVGKVFSLDKLLQTSTYLQEKSDLKFIDAAGNRQMECNQYIQEGTQVIFSTTPRNFEEIGEFFHELGHLLRARKILQDPDMAKVKSEAREELNEMTLDPNYKKKSMLDDYIILRTSSEEERSSWGICLSLIKEVGREVGLDIASSTVIKRILKTAEAHLSLYDRFTPYSLTGHKEDKAKPAFSQKEKIASRKL